MGTKTILLVEDEIITSRTGKISLESHGYRVVTALDGQAALDIFKQENNIDLILMDVDLGSGTSGIETAETILRTKNIPIIFYTGYAEADVVEKTEKISSYGYVLKTSGIAVLDATIKMAFKLFEANLKLEKELLERKKAEENLVESEVKYRTLFENTGTSIIIIDEDTTISLANDEFVRRIGYSRSEIEGKKCWPEFIFQEDLGMMIQQHKLRREDSEKGLKSYEFRYKTKTGEIRYALINIQIMPGTKKSMASLLDITDRKVSEQKVLTLLREKELLLKEVHHRIKNNMNVIRSLLCLHAEYLDDPASVAALKDAENRVLSMMVLYDKLYVSDSYSQLSLKDFLPSLVDEIILNFPRNCPVDVIKKIDDVELGVNVLQPLGIIINELLTNIMKYAFKGKKAGMISVSVSDREGTINLTIQDDGCGMPETVDFHNSPGFGLMMVRMLTEEINGRLWIERGQGTKVILEFHRSQ